MPLSRRCACPACVHNDARNDGDGLVVAEPGKTYNDDFKLQDHASMYGFHLHAHGFTAQQAHHRLESLLFVDDEEEEEDSLRRSLDLALGETETPLVLRDCNFDAQGQRLYPAWDEQKRQGLIGEQLRVNLTDRHESEPHRGAKRGPAA